MTSHQTRHVNGYCTCDNALVPYQQLTDILNKGEIPLVSIESQADTTIDEVTLLLHKRRSRSDYTAISHVWIDGMGNSEANALPLCQLRRLKQRLHDLTRTPSASQSSVLEQAVSC